MDKQTIINKIKEHNEKDKKTFVGKVIKIFPKDNYEYVKFVSYDEKDEPIFISFTDNRLKGKVNVGDFIEIKGKFISKDKVWTDKETNQEILGTEYNLKYISNFKLIEKFQDLEVE